ncbi:SusC/RagA family TonB-linked outer membrane protein [Bacteroidales bacterium]|nr:SusC/RagA family TonB-linked outer membrane protein [Bacteroidales bacterium]
MKKKDSNGIFQDVKPQKNEAKITGLISDDNGEPVIGASVVVKGTKNGTVTDIDGRFSIEAPSDSRLIISYVGYSRQELPIGGKSSFNIRLLEDTQALDEVVVIGYGTQKKVNLTGAVQAINGETLKGRPVSDITKSLQGQVAGMTFTAGGYGFEPGKGMSFQIRGQSDAYVLVDGVPGSLDQLNPNDIENISILKDAAAAAIYGSRGSSGVVLVTTKSGKKNQKTLLGFSANIGVTNSIGLPKMLDSYTSARVYNEAEYNGNGKHLYTDELVDRILAFQAGSLKDETYGLPGNQWASGMQSNGDYDWYKEFYGSALAHNENVSVQGGNHNNSYFISLGNTYEDGILQYGIDDYRRINFLGKMDADLTKWMTLSINTRFDRSTRKRPSFDAQGDYALLFHQIARTFPSDAKYTPFGEYTTQSKIPWSQDSGSELNLDNVYNQRFALKISPTKDWNINADYSFRLSSLLHEMPKITQYEIRPDGTKQVRANTQNSRLDKDQANILYNSFNLYSSYNHSINSAHNFTVMAGGQLEESKTDKLFGTGQTLITPEVPSISTSSGDKVARDEISHWSTAGFFGRLTYNYKERYLFESNVRYDGSSRFARGNRWGFFPSLSGGWNVSREDFWKGSVLDKVSLLKARVSWGQLGNQEVAAYQDLPIMGSLNQVAWILDGNRPYYIGAPQLVNQQLTWETSETLDFGLDFTVLNNRLSFSADWFEQYIKNRLGTAADLPLVIGASLPKDNNAETRTRGWELSIRWRDNIGDFTYSAGATIFDSKTEFTKFYNPQKVYTRDYTGKQVGEIWGYVSDGFINTQAEADNINANGIQSDISGQVWQVGDIKYLNINGSADGKITKASETVDDPGDKKIIGNSTPRYNFGLTLNMAYKGFDFSMMWQGVGKRDIALTGNMFWGFTTSMQSSIFTTHTDYFRDQDQSKYRGLGENRDAYFARPYLQVNLNAKNQQVQTKYIQDGAYIRMKNIQLGYSLSDKIANKLYMQNARFFFSGENLLTFTNLIKHFDPEIATVSSAGRGMGKAASPVSVISFGVDIKF